MDSNPEADAEEIKEKHKEIEGPGIVDGATDAGEAW